MLTDNFLRKHDYLRVSVTDKCNLRCRYCMPPNGVVPLSHDEVLRNEEFVRFIALFARMGVRKFRFTGGEPLIRKGFVDIVRHTREQLPDVELCLTSNGTLLANHIDDLLEHRVLNLNISLDTLSPERFAHITGRNLLDRVLRNIDAVLDRGNFNCKINVVLFRETLDELDAFLDYFRDRPVTIRFIEMMPFTEEFSRDDFISFERLRNELEARGRLERNQATDTNVAMMYKLRYRGRYPISIGIIPPVTRKFCSSCNRLRLTSDGRIRTCLHDGNSKDLKEAMRSGTSDDDLQKIIISAIREKRESHSIECCSMEAGCGSVINCMSKIGG